MNFPDSQEVGLEAATLQRVRNSSLVERFSAENVPRLKLDTEATGLSGINRLIGRGAFCEPVKVDREDGWRKQK